VVENSEGNKPNGTSECLFVCLFAYSHTSNFSAIWWLSLLPVTGLQILACARRSGPLSREGSLSCHTYCDTGPRFIWSHPKDRHPRSTVGFEPPTQGSSDLCARRSYAMISLRRDNTWCKRGYIRYHEIICRAHEMMFRDDDIIPPNNIACPKCTTILSNVLTAPFTTWWNHP
jgi:hypothetical protein